MVMLTFQRQGLAELTVMSQSPNCAELNKLVMCIMQDESIVNAIKVWF